MTDHGWGYQSYRNKPFILKILLFHNLRRKLFIETKVRIQFQKKIQESIQDTKYTGKNGFAYFVNVSVHWAKHSSLYVNPFNFFVIRAKIANGAIVCCECELQGEIDIGTRTVIHPRAKILALSGPIVIGENNIIEEQVQIINRLLIILTFTGTKLNFIFFSVKR